MIKSYELTDPQRKVIETLLNSRVWQLGNKIREYDALSEPVTPGHWRWADVDTSGYRHLTEKELADSRERASARAAQFRRELEEVRGAILALTEGKEP